MKVLSLFKIAGLLLMLICLWCASACEEKKSGPDYETLRKRMVEEQLVLRGINDPDVLRAMKTVERHKFVPRSHRSSAYGDHPLPIGEGQTISQPYIVALMTQLLQADKDSKVLEVGTGSGYQAAVLSILAKEVYTIEIIESLGKSAAERLKQLGYDNAHVRVGDGYAGWPEEAPFDCIIVTCACPRAPGPLVEQLGEGGRMVIPIGDYLSYQTLTLFEKRKGKLAKRDITGCVFVPLLGEHGYR